MLQEPISITGIAPNIAGIAWWQQPWLSDLITAAIGAFIGAAAAFALQNRREDRLQDRVDQRKGQVALVHLLDRYNWLMSLHEQGLGEARDNPKRWVYLPPFMLPAYPTPVDVASLAFLFDGSDAELHNQLLVDQGRFEQVVSILETRNAHHYEYQARTAELERQGRALTAPSEEEAFRIIGKDLIAKLKDETDALYGQADRALVDVKANFARLRKALKARFPNARFLSVTSWEEA